MKRKYDDAGLGSYPNSSEDEPPKKLSLLDLPVDVIEEIGRRSGNSLCYFSLAHPRLATIFSKLKKKRLEIDHTCENFIRSVALNSTDLRALILVNCHSESSLILSLILKCPNVTELNTVNSGLTTPDLVQSINFLSRLEILKCSLPEGPANGRSMPLPVNHSIKSIYVEYGPPAFVYLLKLINSCVKIEQLHFVALPFPALDFTHIVHNIQDHLEGLPIEPPISRERWQTLQTVILVILRRMHGKRELRSLFQNRTESLDVTIEDLVDQKEVVYDHGIFNLGSPKLIVDESPLLSRTYRVGPRDPVWHYGLPRHLKIEDSRAWSLSGSLPQSIASLTTLVELDLSECHGDNQPQIWDPLFQSSTGLESLSVPLCILTIGSCGWRQEENFPFVKALGKLKLKRLLCSGVVCVPERLWSRSCPIGCTVSRLLPNLTGLTHLEELTLINPQVSRDFLRRIAIPSMVCLRVIKKATGYLNFPKMKSFLATCSKLRHLKLDLYNLRFQESLLWRRLSEANLKQLCLNTLSSKAVDIRVVRKFLPKICENLDLLHIHGHRLKNAVEFSSFLETEIAKMNLTRAHNPIRTIPADSRGYNSDDYADMPPNFPGRGLCCVRFRSNFELIGWDMH